MTPYPLDLILRDNTAAEDVKTGLAALPAGRDLLVNLLPESAGIDGDAIVAALRGQDRIAALNLRLGTGAEQLELVEALAAFSAERGIPFHVDLLISDGADVPDFVIHGNGALVPVVEATRSHTGRGQAVRWLIPLTPNLVYRLDGLVSLALQTGATPIVLPQSVLSRDAPELTGDDRLFAWDFFTYRILDRDAESFGRDRLMAYRRLAADLKQDPDALPAGQSAEAWGELNPGRPPSEAPRASGAIGKALLAGPTTDQTGYSGREVLARKVGDVAEVLGYGVSAHLRNIITPAPKPGQPDPEMPFVLLIGAYGGEHIGDAAILGGVLGRIHARHGTRRAILMTQRPNHTRHLMPMLDVPVEVEVQDYSHANIVAALRDVDGVVFAGGPLAEMPKQLVRHLETVTRAKRKGLPFIMEGIGPSAFPRRASHITARKLVKLADRISIRVREDAARPVIAGCEIEIGHDPAFDYLDTRGEVLSRLPSHEPAQIEALLADTEGRPVIGINVRPIGHMYTPAAPGRDRVAYTREVEARFERELAAGLTDYARRSDTEPCFIFFPMNAIQFAASDMLSAWRIMQHLEPGIDFRLWQADASLDGVIALMRRMDTVISMRFHGAIFALSQERNVIGVDYRIGKRYKVTAVLTDAGFEQNCRRFDELEAGWLTDMLLELNPARPETG